MSHQRTPHLTLDARDPFLATAHGGDWVRGAAWVLQQLAERRPAVPHSDLLAAATLVRHAESSASAADPDLLDALDRLCGSLSRPRRQTPPRK